MKRIQFILSVTLMSASTMHAQTEESKSTTELATLASSEVKTNQLSAQQTSDLKEQEASIQAPFVVETKRLPIRDLYVVKVPENTALIIVMRRDGEIVNEILCNNDDEQMAMELGYLPKGKYTLKFESNAQTLQLLHFKKGRVRYN